MTEEDDGEPQGTDEPTLEVVSASDPKRMKAQRKRQARTKNQGEEFWKAAISTETGRREIFDLLRQAGTFEERFACGPNGFPQPEATWFNAGQKAFGERFYLSLARIDRAAVLAMHDENDARFVKPKARSKRDPEGD